MSSELGSPQELGKRFKMIYRPDRFVEFLFVAVPYLLYPLVALLLQRSFGAEFVARGEIILYSALILVGWWRRSILVTLFWATLIIGQIISMLLAGYAFYGSVQSMLWLAFAAILLLLVAQIVWQNRHDPLTATYACLPLLLCAYGSTFVLIHPQNTGSLGFFDIFLLNVYMNGSGYLGYFGYILAIALFFLVTNRDVRWLALAIFGLIDAARRYYLNLSEAMMPPWVYSLYVFIPLLIVLLGWWAERNQRKQISLAA
jgi:hypothetical protein